MTQGEDQTPWAIHLIVAVWFFLLGLAWPRIYSGLRWLVIPTYYEPLDAGGVCANCRCRKSYHTGPKRRCIRFAWEGTWKS